MQWMFLQTANVFRTWNFFMFQGYFSLCSVFNFMFSQLCAFGPIRHIWVLFVFLPQTCPGVMQPYTCNLNKIWHVSRIDASKWNTSVNYKYLKNINHAQDLRMQFLSSTGSCCEYQWMDQNAINYGASQCSDCWQSIFSIITLNCHLLLHIGFYMKVIYVFLIGNLFALVRFRFSPCACLECVIFAYARACRYVTSDKRLRFSYTTKLHFKWKILLP